MQAKEQGAKVSERGYNLEREHEHIGRIHTTGNLPSVLRVWTDNRVLRAVSMKITARKGVFFFFFFFIFFYFFLGLGGRWAGMKGLFFGRWFLSSLICMPTYIAVFSCSIGVRPDR